VQNGGTLPADASLRRLQEREAALTKATKETKEEEAQCRKLIGVFHETQHKRTSALEAAASQALNARYKDTSPKAIEAAREAIVGAILAEQCGKHTSDPLGTHIPTFVDLVLNTGEIGLLLMQRVTREREEVKADIRKRNNQKKAA
jgi:hypothetical protein